MIPWGTRSRSAARFAHEQERAGERERERERTSGSDLARSTLAIPLTRCLCVSLPLPFFYFPLGHGWSCSACDHYDAEHFLSRHGTFLRRRRSKVSTGAARGDVERIHYHHRLDASVVSAPFCERSHTHRWQRRSCQPCATSGEEQPPALTRSTRAASSRQLRGSDWRILSTAWRRAWAREQLGSSNMTSVPRWTIHSRSSPAASDLSSGSPNYRQSPRAGLSTRAGRLASIILGARHWLPKPSLQLAWAVTRRHTPNSVPTT